MLADSFSDELFHSSRNKTCILLISSQTHVRSPSWDVLDYSFIKMIILFMNSIFIKILMGYLNAGFKISRETWKKNYDDCCCSAKKTLHGKCENQRCSTTLYSHSTGVLVTLAVFQREWRRIEAVRCGAPLMLRTHQEQTPLPSDTCPMMLTPQKEWAVVVALVGLGGPPHMRVPIFPLPYQDLAQPSKESDHSRQI